MPGPLIMAVAALGAFAGAFGGLTSPGDSVPMVIASALCWLVGRACKYAVGRQMTVKENRRAGKRCVSGSGRGLWHIKHIRCSYIAAAATTNDTQRKSPNRRTR